MDNKVPGEAANEAKLPNQARLWTSVEEHLFRAQQLRALKLGLRYEDDVSFSCVSSR